MPLSGIRVLDFSWAYAGPYCSMMLGELGADIMKVEQPGAGDETRYWAPFINGESGFFASANRSKRSITLNLKKEEAKQVVRDLAEKADVALENFAPGVAKRLGVDYDTLSAINPRLVYASVSGFGQTGPYRDRKAYDAVLQAMSGLMGLTGPKNGEPVKIGAPVVDIITAVYSAFATLVGLYQRRDTDRGVYIDVSMLESGMSTLTFVGNLFLWAGQNPPPFGSENLSRVPSGNFLAADGRYIHVTINDRQWAALCELLGVPELAADPTLAANKDRTAHRERIHGIVSERIRTKTVEEWDRLFHAAGISAGPVNDLERAFNDPHVVAREVVKSFHHPVAGWVKGVDMPYRFSEGGSHIRGAPPALGEHTEEILKGLLGYPDEQVARLRAAGVIG